MSNERSRETEGAGTDAPRTADADNTLKVHLLDIGEGKAHKYGDCVLCQFGDVSVLIDGGHRGDEELVLGQLRRLLGQDSTVTVSLIIVTHPHDDHIGCLTSLVAQGDLKAKWALVCDPQYRWGDEGNTDADFADLDPRLRGLAEAAFEHDRSDLPDEDVAEFVDAVADLETRYRTMLRQLGEGGATVVLHGTDAEKEKKLKAAFAGIGLEVLGPKVEDLRECFRLLTGSRHDMLDAFDAADFDFSSPAAVANAYRGLVGGVGLTDAAPDKRGATNLQSVVTRFTYNERRLFFAGDMQFADPQVGSQSLRDGVAEMRRRIAEVPGYDFVKLSHHGSDNAFSEETIDDYGETTLYGICCGNFMRGHHPHPEVLRLLDNNRRHLDWVRTDRNGLVTITFGPGGPRLRLSRGRKDDATPPTGESDVDAPTPLADSESPQTPAAGTSGGVAAEVNGRQFSATVPPNATRLSFVLDLNPGSAPAAAAGAAPAGGPSAAVEFDRVGPQVHEAGVIPPGELTPNSADDVESEPGSAEFLFTDADCNVPWRAARSLLTLRDQVNRRAPRRNKADDGTIGDARHCQRTSDHNPWVRDGNVGVVTALDITNDPRGGCDANTIAEAIRASRDGRVKYIIWNRRIANSASIDGKPPWAWRPYNGENPHTRHVHISVKPDKANYDSTAQWAI